MELTLWAAPPPRWGGGGGTRLRGSRGAPQLLGTCAGLEGGCCIVTGSVVSCGGVHFLRWCFGGWRRACWGPGRCDDGLLRGELLGREVPRVERVGQGAVQRSRRNFRRSSLDSYATLGTGLGPCRGERGGGMVAAVFTAVLCVSCGGLLRLPRLALPRPGWAVGEAPCPSLAQCSVVR